MKPTDPEVFANKTGLLLWLVLDTVVDQNPKSDELNPEDLEFWRTHSDAWIRWLHANNDHCRKKINSAEGRDFVYAFAGHWLKAMIYNPFAYRERHPMEALV